MSVMTVKYVLGMELLSGKNRVTIGMGFLTSYAFGITTFPFLCYWLRSSKLVRNLNVFLGNCVYAYSTLYAYIHTKCRFKPGYTYNVIFELNLK